jgi:hypothetical protein
MLCYVVLYSVVYLYLPLFEWCQVRINPHRPVHYNMLHSSLTPSLTHSSTHSWLCTLLSFLCLLCLILCEAEAHSLRELEELLTAVGDALGLAVV